MAAEAERMARARTEAEAAEREVVTIAQWQAPVLETGLAEQQVAMVSALQAQALQASVSPRSAAASPILAAAVSAAEASAALQVKKFKQELERAEERRKDLEAKQVSLTEQLRTAEQTMQEKIRATELNAAKAQEELQRKQVELQMQIRAAEYQMTAEHDEAEEQRELLQEQLEAYQAEHKELRHEFHDSIRLRDDMRNRFGKASVIVAKVAAPDVWQGQMERLCLGGTGDGARIQLEQAQREQMYQDAVWHAAEEKQALAVQHEVALKAARDADDLAARTRALRSGQKQQEASRREKIAAEISASRKRAEQAAKAAAKQFDEMLRTQMLRNSASMPWMPLRPSPEGKRGPTLPKRSITSSLPRLKPLGPPLVASKSALLHASGPPSSLAEVRASGGNDFNFVTFGPNGSRRSADVLQTAVRRTYEGYALRNREMRALRAHVDQDRSQAVAPEPLLRLLDARRSPEPARRVPDGHVVEGHGDQQYEMLTISHPPDAQSMKNGPFGGLVWGSPRAKSCSSPGIRVRQGWTSPEPTRGGGTPPTGATGSRSPQSSGPTHRHICATTRPGSSDGQEPSSPQLHQRKLQTAGGLTLPPALSMAQDRASLSRMSNARSEQIRSRQGTGRGSPTSQGWASPPLRGVGTAQSYEPPSTPCDGEAYRLERERQLASRASTRLAGSPTPGRARSPYSSRSPNRSPNLSPRRQPHRPQATKVTTLPILEKGVDFTVEPMHPSHSWIYYDLFS